MNTTIIRGATRWSRPCFSPSFLNDQRIFITAQNSLLPRRASTSSVALHDQDGKINGPASTLPPPFNVPDRKPGQSFPSHLLAVGKAYLSFYKSGGKAALRNFRASRAIRAAIDSNYDGSMIKAIERGFLDRSNFQLLVRSRFDIRRLPIFALVFLVFEEFTPFVIIAFSDIVPYTCRIPRQIERDRKILERFREISFRNLESNLSIGSVGVEGLTRPQLLHISRSLGLSSIGRGRLGNILPILPTPLLRRKVKKRVEYLNIDDGLILRYGGIGGMNVEETKIALVERGIDVLGKNEKDLKDSMRAWLQSRKEVSIEGLLLTRPSSWPRKNL